MSDMDPDYIDYLFSLGAVEIEVPPHIFEEGDDEDYQVEEEEEEEEEDEEEEGEEEEEEEEEEEDDNGDGADGDGINSGTGAMPSEEVVIIDSVVENDDEATVEGESESGSKKGRAGSDGKGGGTPSLKGEDGLGEFSRGEVDGLFCPICFEAWSSSGDHHICCLPCGHIYGLSCIRKWLARRGSSKCPQCKKNCRMKDIRLLYATQIVAIDGELQKTVQSLEAKCASLEKQSAEWSKEELEWKKKENVFRKRVQYLEERTRDLEVLLENEERRASGSSAVGWNSLGKSTLGPDATRNFHMKGCSNKFTIQKDFQIDGARLFDVDSSSENYIFARRLIGMGGMHVLTKVSLLYSHEKEDIGLPENTKAVKDLQVSPDARSVLLASLGKKLSVICTQSNSIVFTCDLPAAGWSCSWDFSDSHYVYTGLQNGTVLQFDMRHTTRYVESLNGLTCNPIHSLYSLSPSSSRSSFTRNVPTRNVLTASSLGLCQWDFGVNQERPYLIPESEKQGVCISLAHSKTSDDIVASYRPKIGTPDDPTCSQPTLTAARQGTQGSHVYYGKDISSYKKVGAICANVSDIRLPKTTIIDGVHKNRAFASGDESTSELVLHELPSLMAFDRLQPWNNPIRDVKFVRRLDLGLLSCLSEDTLQLYTAKGL